MGVFLTFMHVVICLTLIVVVLLQAGRGAGMAGVFGASSAAGQQFFGGRGAGGFLGKLTAVLAILFMVTSITLTLIGGTAGGKYRSVVRDRSGELELPTQPGTAPTEIPAGEGGELPISPTVPADEEPAAPGP